MSVPANKIKYTIGQTIGSCIYLGEEVSKKWRRYAKFKCHCGKEFHANIQQIKSGHTKSCGCNLISFLISLNGDHMKSSSPEFTVWDNMIQRCNNPKYRFYKDYGGRGIKVCERWQVFKNFYEDMGDRPSPKHELDRYPNNDGDYEVGNCRWATKKQNCRNRRSNVLIEYNGETKTLIEWTEKLGLNYNKTWQRIKVLNWDIKRALETPIDVKYARSI